jgi:hypothetical protein
MNKKVIQGKSLAWSISSYTKLSSKDLLPTPAPTDAQRIRVAAALATIMRDEAMLELRSSGPNSETIRAVLVMSAEEWALQIGSVAKVVKAYDAVNPRTRFEQICDAYTQPSERKRGAN